MDSWENDAWKEIHKGTSIGARRLIKLDTPVTTPKLRIRFTKTPEVVVLSELGVYKVAE